MQYTALCRMLLPTVEYIGGSFMSNSLGHNVHVYVPYRNRLFAYLISVNESWEIREKEGKRKGGRVHC